MPPKQQEQYKLFFSFSVFILFLLLVDLFCDKESMLKEEIIIN